MHLRAFLASAATDAATETSGPLFTRLSMILLIRGVPPPLIDTNCLNIATKMRMKCLQKAFLFRDVVY
jgi:hypothetical protein